MAQVRYAWIVSSMALLAQQLEQLKRWHAHTGSRTRVTSMGGLYDAATLRALLVSLRGDYRITQCVFLNCARSTAAVYTVTHAMRPGLDPRARVSAAAVAVSLRRLWSLGRGEALLC